MDHLKDIVNDISKEKCILILGPDIIDSGDKSFFETMCAAIGSGSNKVIETAPQFIFKNEELLQLVPPAKELTVLRMIENFYQQQIAFDIPLTKVSQIPFHLVISLMPDDRLQSLFKKQSLPFRYAHYPKEGAHPVIEKPVRDQPLLYNLLGDFNELEAIITFDNLFEFLSGIMGKRELPQALQETLKTARSFVFLGVHFEKWYVQLLLRIITTKEQKDKFISLKNTDNSEVFTFIARRHELDFINNDPLQFLDQLYEACKDRGLLKTIKATQKGRVFISYTHHDKEVAQSVRKLLEAEHMEVVQDELSMKVGQRIEDFISVIKDCDAVLVILSKQSILSPWVSKEIITTVERTETHLMPCYLDQSFMDTNFESEAKVVASENVQRLNKSISERDLLGSEDLETQRKLWTDYYANLPKVLKEINGRKFISLLPSDFEKSMNVIIKEAKQIAVKK